MAMMHPLKQDVIVKILNADGDPEKLAAIQAEILSDPCHPLYANALKKSAMQAESQSEPTEVSQAE